MNTQIHPGSIVVAVDGSSQAERAVHWAAEQAALERRTLVAVAVAGDLSSDLSADPIDRARAVAGDATQLALTYRPEIAVESVGLTGSPREKLVEMSSGLHMIVMGSRGRGAIGTKLLGSVSASVSRHAHCPVVVCRPGSELDVKHGVVVGADGTPESLPILEFAFREASLRERPLTVLHSTWDVFASLEGPGLVDESEAEQTESRLLLSESVAGFREKFPDVRVSLQLARGYADESLTADSARWDLIVVGRHPTETMTRRVSGIVATSVLEHSTSTVAVVPEANPAE